MEKKNIQVEVMTAAELDKAKGGAFDFRLVDTIRPIVIRPTVPVIRPVASSW